MWEVWSMSQSLRCRPSSLLGVFDPLTAFYVDRATYTLAMAIESDMEAAVTRLPDSAKQSAHNRARQRVLDKFLGYSDVEHPERFRAPSSR